MKTFVTVLGVLGATAVGVMGGSVGAAVAIVGLSLAYLNTRSKVKSFCFYFTKDSALRPISCMATSVEDAYNLTTKLVAWQGYAAASLKDITDGGHSGAQLKIYRPNPDSTGTLYRETSV